MGKQIHLSATAAVRRTVKGDTLSLSLITNGKPLFQGLNPTNYTVSPTWSESANQPMITPKVSSASQKNVTLTNHRWFYNGNELIFSTGGTGWETSTSDKRFQLNLADGSLKIIGDLASVNNQDSDTLTYSGVAVSGVSTYPMEKSIDILVAMLGATSYAGGVSADTTILSKGQTTATLTPWLFDSNGTVSTYKVKLYRGSGNDLAGEYNFPASKTITIHRDQEGDTDKLYVDSHQLFVLEFIVDGAPVYRTGISIDDISDLYQLALNSEGEVDETHNQVFRCVVTNCETGRAANITGGDITFTVFTDDKNEDGKMNVKAIYSETMEWAVNVSKGFTVTNDYTIDKETKKIIGVSVSADATLEVE